MAKSSFFQGSTDYTNLDQTIDDFTTVDIVFVIDGGGLPISAGEKGTLQVPFAGTITKATLLADQAGDIVVDVWKDTYDSYPPTSGDSICASALPTLSSEAKSVDETLTGWTTSIAEDDVLRLNVVSASTVTQVTLQLTVTLSLG